MATHAERDRTDAAKERALLAEAEEPRSIDFPLQRGRKITITIPVPLTPSEFDFGIEFLGLIRRVLGEEIVVPPPPPPPP